MNAQHLEHLEHSSPCTSRWDGFDRGDVNQDGDVDLLPTIEELESSDDD